MKVFYLTIFFLVLLSLAKKANSIRPLDDRPNREKNSEEKHKEPNSPRRLPDKEKWKKGIEKAGKILKEIIKTVGKVRG